MSKQELTTRSFKVVDVVDAAMIDVLRSKTPAERIRMIGAANRTARILARAGIRYQHPDWTEAQVHEEVLRRVCGGTT